MDGVYLYYKIICFEKYLCFNYYSLECIEIMNSEANNNMEICLQCLFLITNDRPVVYIILV